MSASTMLCNTESLAFNNSDLHTCNEFCKELANRQLFNQVFSYEIVVMTNCFNLVF